MLHNTVKRNRQRTLPVIEELSVPPPDKGIKIGLLIAEMSFIASIVCMFVGFFIS